ncbi:hypothetical protein HC752_05355 [Vibrio sp. S9_S30]|nr:hypothetical protein [Vibrio sp. S9_S30]
MRIIPPYYCALLFSLALVYLFLNVPDGSQWDISIPITLEGIISHFLLLNDLFGGTQINYVFWSVALEFKLYFLFLFFLYIWRRFGALSLLVGVSILVYTTIIILEAIGLTSVPPQFLGLILFFVMGMLSSYLGSSINKENAGKLLVLGVFLFVILVLSCIVIGIRNAHDYLIYLDTILAVSTSFLLISMNALGTPKILRC